MANRYLKLESAREHTTLRVRLGLCVIDLAPDAPGVPHVADTVVREALDSADAYAAHDALSHPGCLPHTDADATQSLTDLVQVSGLARGTMPADLRDDLMNSVNISGACMAATTHGQL